MSRSLSLLLREAMFAEATSEVFACLLTVTHSTLDTPIRLSTDATTRIQVDPELIYGTVSRGNTYLFLPISVELPDDSDGKPVEVTLTMDNVNRQLIPTIRGLNSLRERAKVTVECFRVGAPDIVEFALPSLDLLSASYDALQTTVTLGIDALINEQYPAGAFVPSGFPGLF